ncbi:LytTR family DNA-binding domain-containing protein [Clostridiaceae bacterium M8S5]|nr:LytTR family DNA-binding domain-containing protein [Clostridiaceae bacterium M8S5]
MRLRLFPDKNIREEHIDIHYKDMTPMIEQVIGVVQSTAIQVHIVGKSEKNEEVLLSTNEIYYFEYVDKKTFACLEHKIYQVQDSLNKLEMDFADEGFVRINKSIVANIYHIKAIKPEANMRLLAIMENDENLIINRTYKKQFREYLKERRNIL